MPVALSVLDFGSLGRATVGKRLRDVRREVKVADDHGYARYWLGEHHSSNSSWAGPDLLLPALAESTRRIRIGAAGVLLASRSPVQVANDFSLASNLYPNRIDLGIGRGSPGTGASSPEAFQANLGQLLAMLSEKSKIPAIPPARSGLEVWLLGSNVTSMRLAASFGTAFSYSLFHGPNSGHVLQEYRQTFRPGLIRKPAASIAVAGYCAAKEKSARRQYASHRNEFIRPMIVGDPHQCHEQLLELAQRYAAREIVFLNLMDRVESRCDALVLLSEHLGLPACKG